MKVAVVCGCKQNLSHIWGSVGYSGPLNKLQNSAISNHIASIFSEVNKKVLNQSNCINWTGEKGLSSGSFPDYGKKMMVVSARLR